MLSGPFNLHTAIRVLFRNSPDKDLTDFERVVKIMAVEKVVRDDVHIASSDKSFVCY
jgi:hypothetical protein